MAFGFGSTYGAGATDAVNSSLVTSSTARSWAFTILRHGGGGSTGGRVFSRFTTVAKTAVMERFFWNIASNAFQFQRGYSTTTGAWFYTSFSTLDTWLRCVVTHDGSTSPPNVYVNGVLQTLSSTPSSPVGTLLTGNQPMEWGNTSDTGTREHDGLIQAAAVFDRVLTAAEALAYGKGFSPLLIGRLASYLPLVRNAVDLIGAAPTVIGTVVQPHNPVLNASAPIEALGPPVLSVTMTAPASTAAASVLALVLALAPVAPASSSSASALSPALGVAQTAPSGTSSASTLALAQSAPLVAPATTATASALAPQIVLAPIAPSSPAAASLLAPILQLAPIAPVSTATASTLVFGGAPITVGVCGSTRLERNVTGATATTRAPVSSTTLDPDVTGAAHLALDVTGSTTLSTC